MKGELCPAWQKGCQKCNGRNHFSTVCRRGKPREDVRGIHEHEDDDSYEGSDCEFLSSSVTLEPINAVAPTSGFAKEIYTELQIDDERVKFQIDCGATINIINKRHAGSNVMPSSKTLKMWNGTHPFLLEPHVFFFFGTTRLLLRNPKTKKKYSIKFVVVPDNLNPLIGAHTAQQMGLITVHTQSFVPVSPPERKKSEDINKIEAAEQLIQQCQDVLSKDLGTFPGTVHLQVDENAKPSITPPRRVPTALREKCKDELNRLENLGALAKVDEPTAWVSSVVIASKKSGALRICIDPRPLNQALKTETYQLPVLDDLMPDLAKAKVFSTVDLTAGYWHCVLDDASSLLTTFATPYGSYK